MKKQDKATQDKFIKELSEYINILRLDEEVETKIKKFIATTYNVLPGTVVEVFNNPEEILEIINDYRELVILCKQLNYYGEPIGAGHIDLHEYFTDNEIHSIRNYDASTFNTNLELPYTFDDVLQISADSYIVPLKIQEIKGLYESQVLFYDYDIQRELTFVKRKNGEVRKQPTLYKNNVKEISTSLLKNELKPTTLIWNANKGSSELDSEIQYDPKRAQLTITKGTELAIMDGYHRLNGLIMALEKDPNLNFTFPVMITNYTKVDAQKFQAQIAKATPISRNRQVQLERENLATDVVTNLDSPECELENRIEMGNVLGDNTKAVVRYKELVEAVENNFVIRSKRDVKKVSEYLIEFFNEFINLYIDEFTNYPASKSYSVVTNRLLFNGYVALAAEMLNKNIDVDNLKEILSKVDFNKNDNKWCELEVTDEYGNLNSRHLYSKSKIDNVCNYFKSLI